MLSFQGAEFSKTMFGQDSKDLAVKMVTSIQQAFVAGAEEGWISPHTLAGLKKKIEHMGLKMGFPR